MVSFQCDGCGDVVKKPKLVQHGRRCQSSFTCIDCSTTFTGTSYQSHTSCITEEEKYQKSMYKKKGQNNGQAKQQARGTQAAPATPAKTDEKPAAKKDDKPVAKADAKPVSLIQELKQKTASENKDDGKRKRDEGETKSAKKAKEESSGWAASTLPSDTGKAIVLALQEVLSKESLALKDARKKAIKLLLSHPKGTFKDKKKLKDAFDEVLTLKAKDNVITLQSSV